MNRFLDRGLLAIARWLDPTIADQPVERQTVLKADAFGLVMTVPVLVAGLITLAGRVELGVLRDQGLLLLLFAALIWVIQQMPVFLLFEIGPGRHAQTTLTFESILVWTVALVLGPTALICVPILAAIDALRERSLWRQARNRSTLLRSLAYGLTIDVVGIGLGLMVYAAWGGEFPFVGFNTPDVLAAGAGMLIRFGLGVVTLLPFNWYIRQAFATLGRGAEVRQFLITITLAALGSLLLAPFGLVGAGLLSQFGLAVFGLYAAGLLALIALAWRLSGTVERSQRQAAQMARLDQLTRASVTATPEMGALRELLAEHVPGILPPSGRIEVQIDAETLLRFPLQTDPQPLAAWQWLEGQTRPSLFAPRQPRPWLTGAPDASVLLAVPVRTAAGTRPQGGLIVSAPAGLLDRDLPPLSQLREFQPVAQSLAALIASMLERQAQEREAIAHRRRLHDLEVAGQIQSSLMPTGQLGIPNWPVAAFLISARETSGDLFDIVALADRTKFAVVVADVADKGTGAALFMVLARTLLRTYLETEPDRPDAVFAAVNRRLLSDSQAGLFVTAFMAVIEVATGRLVYANAGHNPPLFWTADGACQALTKTGMPLGVLEEASWGARSLTMNDQDVLVLYTDGVTEAVDPSGAEYAEQRLRGVVAQARRGSVDVIRQAVADDLRAFSAEADQVDDITVVVVKRDEPPKAEADPAGLAVGRQQGSLHDPSQT
jgi:serine phosphatase RsbU (regulator of sigma subunit)